MKETERKTLQRWAYIGGIYNLVFGLSLSLPILYKQYFKTLQMLNKALRLGGDAGAPPKHAVNEFMVNLSGILLCVLGLNLLYAARDVTHRSALLAHNILGRIATVAVILYYLRAGNIARILVLFGSLDLLIGGVYAYYLTKLRGTSLRKWFK